MTTIDERRRQQRQDTPDSRINITLHSDNSVSPNSLEKISVTVLNTSSSGICIVTEQPFELGQIINFSDKTINKTGAVVWTYQYKAEFRSGVKFV